jgi:hypothetical protein
MNKQRFGAIAKRGRGFGLENWIEKFVGLPSTPEK